MSETRYSGYCVTYKTHNRKGKSLNIPINLKPYTLINYNKNEIMESSTNQTVIGCTLWLYLSEHEYYNII